MQKVAIITGGGTGIGKEVALHLGKKEITVVISGRKRGPGLSVVNELLEKGSTAAFISANVTKNDEVKKMMGEIITKYGRLDFAFNNAGINCSGEIVHQNESDFDKVIATNLKRIWLCMKYQLKIMQRQRSGSIVNNLSVHAFRTVFPKIAAYCASKSGGTALTKIAAIENASYGIRVNGIAPGPIDTEMYRDSIGTIGGSDIWEKKIPIGRAGTTSEIASAVSWLLLESASFVNGHILAIDGGFLAC